MKAFSTPGPADGQAAEAGFQEVTPTSFSQRVADALEGENPRRDIKTILLVLAGKEELDNVDLSEIPFVTRIFIKHQFLDQEHKTQTSKRVVTALERQDN